MQLHMCLKFATLAILFDPLKMFQIFFDGLVIITERFLWGSHKSTFAVITCPELVGVTTASLLLSCMLHMT